MKRFNLGFKYFGFPEQCSKGKYCLYEEAEARFIQDSNKIHNLEAENFELEFEKIPYIETHYRTRMIAIFIVLYASLIYIGLR